MKKTICLLCIAAALAVAGGAVSVRVDPVSAGQGSGTNQRVQSSEELAAVVRSMPSASDYYNPSGLAGLSSVAAPEGEGDGYDLSNMTVEIDDSYYLSNDSGSTTLRRNLIAYYTQDCAYYEGDIYLNSTAENYDTVYDSTRDEVLNVSQQTTMREVYSLYLSEGLVLIRFDKVEMNTSYRYTTETGLPVDYTPEETSDPTEEISDAIMDEYRNHYGVWIRLNMTQEDVPFDMSADMDDLSEDEMVDMLVFSAMYGVSVSLVTGLVQVDEMNDMFYTDIERLLSLGDECYDTVGGLKLLNDTGRDSVSLSNMTNGLRFAFDLSDEEAPAIICHDDSSFLIDGDGGTDEVIGGIIEALGYNYSYEQTIRFRYIGNTVINAPAEGEYPTLYDVFGDKIKEIVYDMWQETQGE